MAEDPPRPGRPRILVVEDDAALRRALVATLDASGFEVVGLDAFVDYYPRAAKERNLRRARDHRSFRFVEGCVQDTDLPPALEGVDQVFHLAAQAGVRASWGRDFALYTDHNVLATQRLLGPFRGEPAVDRAALVDVLLGLSTAATADPSIRSADLNPLIVVDGRPVPVDALVEVDG